VRARVAAAVVSAVGTALLGGRPARADVIYELLPAVAVGATDNALGTPTPQPPATEPQPVSDVFGSVMGNARVRYRGARAEHALGYRLNVTRYLRTALTTQSHEVAALSAFTLSATLDLHLGASVTYARTSAFSGVDAMTYMLQGVPGGDRQYVALAANEELSYQPNPRRRYSQAIRCSNLQYVNVPAGMPAAQTTTVGTMLRAQWEAARDLLSAQLDVTEAHTVTGNQDAVDTILVTALGGWRRELSVAWSLDTQAGAMGIFTPQLDGVIGPAGMATLGYRRVAWFASLTVAQAPALNVFTGSATINDQAVARLALPLTKDERLNVIGFGGYTYARAAFSPRSGWSSQRVYDQRMAGVSLTAHARTLPFWSSLEYSLMDQHGNVDTGGNYPDLRRQTIMLTVGGAFVFGAGAPPVFRGVL
jgi:hypothetical protein